ncbi:dephospho-CoA kinase [Brachyspira hyodysenteriae]|uniref:dephospho-CoA kinase n=1 Tax=Brachyspira hyodysenteriae TaxID=159 RepID=UPI00063DB8B8|nr:dephospho-CoA kinase [Brachyspira hyodysenteriae]KLI14721.1 dephospho-CoA kinase [Brachyspira hyodysenteriae]KLI18307.1 dephospho-CoA kinase [Brachyspira hyodysenteriae]KLI20494.1 dephospho-CoA kinase [Brachyspira hyodysenteriae]KLI21724.1 dephospho-CoA kinase [Brachyspira hyodysenteriae]KLI22910.1 dephospho-CoA kinase [Brachyspira hyodysenteriae]
MERNIVGVYGLICSGKSSFSKMLAKEMDALYIDADLIGHEALINNKDNIVKEFSSSILDENNNIDRKKLGSIVFCNAKKLKKLQELNYPYIENKVKEIVESTDKDVVIEAALIMRSKIRFMCSSLIYVNSKTSDIIKRMKKTRNISETEARKRLKMQRDVKNNRLNADILINNMKDYNNLIIISKKLGRYYGVKSKSKHRRKRIFY